MKIIWPNFFIVGAPRAGHTSLYNYLDRVQEIYMSPAKAPGYLSNFTFTFLLTSLFSIPALSIHYRIQVLNPRGEIFKT